MVSAQTRTYELFERIAADKRERILQAALEEFANNDYAQASTNAIVERAGISKGLLFHYFGDKAGLYSYLLNDISKKYSDLVMQQVGLNPAKSIDVFEVLKQTVQIKLETTRSLLLETQFFIRAMKSSLPPELSEQLQGWVTYAYDQLALITSSLDENLLREGISRDQAARLINWMMEGLTNEQLAQIGPNSSLEDYQQMTDKAEENIDLLRTLFYKDAMTAQGKEAQ